MAMVEVRVLVPEQRVAEYYRMVGMWLDRGAGAKKPEPTLSPKSRYAPLQEHLEGVARDRQAVKLGFGEIGKVLGKALPRSAYAHRAWWANTGSHAQALAWLTAGWKVDHVDLPGKTVEFARVPRT
jgi:hypothetical protein